ncbi:endonuclease/exonuclease/phosphatase family protein [Elusimicrobiota bacterium]
MSITKPFKTVVAIFLGISIISSNLVLATEYAASNREDKSFAELSDRFDAGRPSKTTGPLTSMKIRSGQGKQNQDAGQTITILTYNVFHPFFGAQRKERAYLLPKAIMQLDPVPDIIVFEEAFKEELRDVVVEELKREGYPVNAVYYKKLQYGSGILFISRFDLDLAEFTPYRVAGSYLYVERYIGKGVLHCRISTPYGPMEIFATHPISRMFVDLYDENGNHIDRDLFTTSRLLEMEQIAQAMKTQADPDARSIIVAGDINASPDLWSYQYLLARTGLEDSFSKVNPGKQVSTYSIENTFINKNDLSRIDHIFYKNQPGTNGFWVEPVKSSVVMKETYEMADGKDSNLADHFGVLTVFTLKTTSGEVAMSPSLRPERKSGKRSKIDLYDNSILLTPENHLAWQNWAVHVLNKADRRHNQHCLRIIPAAKVMIAGEVTEPTLIPISPLQRTAVKADLLGITK